MTTPRRGGLGRGLGALIPATEEPGGGRVRFAELPLDAISPNTRQPRTVFDEDALAELVASVGMLGVLQPVVVRPLGDDRYELVMGERRWRAARAAGLASVPAVVRDTADDAMLRDALLENLHRSDLNPLEEAAAYEQLLVDFGCTHEELAARLGRSRPQVTNTLRLLRLPPSVARRVAAGVLSAGHARALLALDDTDAQETLAARIVAEGLSVRAAEEIVAHGPHDEPRIRAKRTKRSVPVEVSTVADRLADRLDTRVGVTLSRSHGRLTIDFASPQDLARIAALLGVDDRP